MPLISLTTDFGTRDSFVGTMKGVIAGLAPAATVIDLSHEIPAGDIRSGAFALASAAHHFPAGTIHVAVVDPGVGSERRALAVRTSDAVFIGPDNGVLSWAWRDLEPSALEARVLENPAWRLQPVSRTFHGRDVFAPAAARLARGDPFAEAGPQLDPQQIARLPWPELARNARSCAGEVVHVDRFGNAITNIPFTAVPPEAIERDTVKLHLSGGRTIPLGDFYAAVPVGRPVAVGGSSGFIEIAINRGHAAQTLALDIGAPIVAVW